MSDMDNPYRIEAYETLPELLGRIAFEAGFNPKQLLGTRAMRGALNDARGRFCYEAYASGRYSMAYVARFCGCTKKSLYWRIRSYAVRHKLPYPHRDVECVLADATRKYTPGDLAIPFQ